MSKKKAPKKHPRKKRSPFDPVPDELKAKNTQHGDCITENKCIISKQLREQLIKGGPLLARGVRFRVAGVRAIYSDMLSRYVYTVNIIGEVIDKNDQALTQFCSAWISENNTLTVVEMERAFNLDVK